MVAPTDSRDRVRAQQRDRVQEAQVKTSGVVRQGSTGPKAERVQRLMISNANRMAGEARNAGNAAEADKLVRLSRAVQVNGNFDAPPSGSSKTSRRQQA
jgi:hypothetical protein